MNRVVHHPEAEDEFETAQLWYFSHSQRAARRFAAAVDRVVEQFRVRPDRYPLYDSEFREAGMTDYPYSVIYRALLSGDVQVIAVPHASRAPGDWRDRA